VSVFSAEVFRSYLTEAEQRKAALKKVSEELDEAEEIVSALLLFE
jgi:hypothetical protein